MADRLPKRLNPRPALNCAKCYMWDSSGVCARPHVVRLVHQWSPKFSFLWDCFYERGWHHRLLHWGHCRQRCYFTKQSFIWTEQVVPRKLSNSPLGKVRSNASDEKTAYRSSKFGHYRRWSNRLGETHSPFGRHYRWPAGLVTSSYRCKKEFCEQTEPLKEEFVLKERSPSGFVF